MKRRFFKVKENDCNINYHETKIVFATFLKDKEESFLGIISQVIIFRLRIPRGSIGILSLQNKDNISASQEERICLFFRLGTLILCNCLSQMLDYYSYDTQ